MLLSSRNFPAIPKAAPIRPVGWRREVFVDGERIPLAFQASVKEGFADTYVDDGAGGLARDDFDRLKTERRQGSVELRRCN
jgi:hypothetical protein